jgi:hypothetical protein
MTKGLSMGADLTDEQIGRAGQAIWRLMVKSTKTEQEHLAAVPNRLPLPQLFYL